MEAAAGRGVQSPGVSPSDCEPCIPFEDEPLVLGPAWVFPLDASRIPGGYDKDGPIEEEPDDAQPLPSGDVARTPAFNYSVVMGVDAVDELDFTELEEGGGDSKIADDGHGESKSGDVAPTPQIPDLLPDFDLGAPDPRSHQMSASDMWRRARAKSGLLEVGYDGDNTAEGLRGRFLRIVSEYSDCIAELATEDSTLPAGRLFMLRALPWVVPLARKRPWVVQRHSPDPEAFESGIDLLSEETRASFTLYAKRGVEGVAHTLRALLRPNVVVSLSERLAVRFDSEIATGPGVARDWFSTTARLLLRKDLGLFKPVGDTQQGGILYYRLRPAAWGVWKEWGIPQKSVCRSIGHFVGLAIRHGVPIDMPLAPAVCKHMVCQPLTLRDLRLQDASACRSLEWMMSNDVDDLELTWEFQPPEHDDPPPGSDVAESAETLKPIEAQLLVEGGDTLKVTNENKAWFVRAMASAYLLWGDDDALREFLRGVHAVLPKHRLALLQADELSHLLCGLPVVDVDDWKAHTVLSGYEESSDTVKWFWNIVSSYTHEQRSTLLQFITGSSRVPPGGFAALPGSEGEVVLFQLGNAQTDDTHLPVVHTCFNQLLLPVYPSEAALKEKLEKAMREGILGFGAE